MPKKDNSGGNLFAEQLNLAMTVQNMDMYELARRLDCTYEYVRKLRIGDALPSKAMVKNICRELGMPETLLQTYAARDHIRREYGDSIFELLSGKDSEMQRLEPIWRRLSHQDREQLVTIAKTFATRQQPQQPTKPKLAVAK